MSLLFIYFACTAESPKPEAPEAAPKNKTHSSIEACIKECLQQSQMQSRPIEMIEKDCQNGCNGNPSPLQKQPLENSK